MNESYVFFMKGNTAMNERESGVGKMAGYIKVEN